MGGSWSRQDVNAILEAHEARMKLWHQQQLAVMQQSYQQQLAAVQQSYQQQLLAQQTHSINLNEALSKLNQRCKAMQKEMENLPR